MTVTSTVEWLQQAINAQRIEDIDRRVTDLEATLVGEIRQMSRELVALRAALDERP